MDQDIDLNDSACRIPLSFASERGYYMIVGFLLKKSDLKADVAERAGSDTLLDTTGLLPAVNQLPYDKYLLLM